MAWRTRCTGGPEGGLIHLRELEDVIALEFFGIHVGYERLRLQLLGRLFVVEH